MVVKRKGADAPVLLACTLLPYAPEFELGATLAEAEAPVALNHPHCAKFCVLGGASCCNLWNFNALIHFRKEHRLTRIASIHWKAMPGKEIRESAACLSFAFSECDPPRNCHLKSMITQLDHTF
jgi:hypothetical protein